MIVPQKHRHNCFQINDEFFLHKQHFKAKKYSFDPADQKSLQLLLKVCLHYKVTYQDEKLWDYKVYINRFTTLETVRSCSKYLLLLFKVLVEWFKPRHTCIVCKWCSETYWKKYRYSIRHSLLWKCHANVILMWIFPPSFCFSRITFSQIWE